MRALIVVLALVAAPFLAAVSQSPQGSDCDNGQGDEHRSDSGQVHAHQGLCALPPVLDADLDGVPDALDQCPGTPPGTTVNAFGCPVEPPPPPPACGNSDLVTGIATIRGQVFTDQPPWTLLGGWCVELQDASSGAVVGTALTTATSLDGLAGNNFLFVNVPAGAYIMCEQLLDATWHQTEPPGGSLCGVNPDLTPRYGFAVTILITGGDYSFFMFGNLQ